MLREPLRTPRTFALAVALLPRVLFLPQKTPHFLLYFGSFGFWVLFDGHWSIEGAIDDESHVCTATGLRSRRGFEMALWISFCDLDFVQKTLDNGNTGIAPNVFQ